MQRRSSLWLTTVVLLLAAWARLGRLTWYSLDVDEAFSLYWARVPLARLVPDLIALRGDPHPPGYYALLKPWLYLLGENEVGLRLFSALAGVIFVALVWRLGRELLGGGPALAAALLAAVSPGLVYESLDARMYMPAAAFALAGAWALWRGLERDGRRVLALILSWIALTLACYAHLAGALFVAGLGPAVLLWATPGPRRDLASRLRLAIPGLATLLAVGLAYLPYALNAWGASAVSGGVITRAAPGPVEMLRVAADWLILHNAAPASPLDTLAPILLWLLVILGGLSARRRFGTWLGLLTLLLVPLLLVVLLSQRQAFLQPKILAVTTAGPLLLALGAPLVGPRPPWARWSTTGAGLLLFAIAVWGYARLWSPDAGRDNWEAAAAYLTEHAGPRDVVLTHLHFHQEALRFYYAGPIIAPFGSRLTDDEEVARGLAPYLDHEVLWLAQSGHEYTDPESRLEHWLMARFPLVTSQYPTHITLKGFLLRSTGLPPLPGARPLGIAFADGTRLSAYWLDQRRLSPVDRWLHPPSNWLHVILYATPGDYRLTLEDEAGNIWGEQLPREGVPVAGKPEETIRLDFDINLNPEMPAGRYKVVVRLRGAQGPVPRADNGATYLILEEVEVLPAP